MKRSAAIPIVLISLAFFAVTSFAEVGAVDHSSRMYHLFQREVHS